MTYPPPYVFNMFRLVFIKAMAAVIGVEEQSSVKGYLVFVYFLSSAKTLTYIYYLLIDLQTLSALDFQNKQNIHFIKKSQ